MKIGFVSRFAPTDRKSSSGTLFKMFEALSTEHTVTHIPYHHDAIARACSATMSKVARARGKKVAADFTKVVSRRLAQTVDPGRLKDVDVVVVPFGAPCLAELKTDKPVIYLSDTTFEALYGYYPSFSEFMGFNYRQGTSIERRALQKGTKVLLGSDWARVSAIQDYEQDPAKIHVLEYGANLPQDDPEALRERSRTARRTRTPDGSPLSLLFLGVDWERKGGDIAVECCRALLTAGVHARLEVVGTTLPPRHRGNDLIHDHGFLDKNVPSDVERLRTIMEQADLLLLPTRAECSAIVYCEAAAHGLPAFTTDTGGVPNYVVNGVNGHRLPLTSTGADFAARILHALETGELENLRDGAFRIYADRLNWNRWLEGFNACLRDLAIAQ